jgi:hypothetical protein
LSHYVINKLRSDKTFTGVCAIAVLHAERVPPHVGLITSDSYHSLTIKGHELNLPVAALIRNARLREMKAVFYHLQPHPIFSIDFLREIFVCTVQQFNKVNANGVTCLSPVKIFLDEIYGVNNDDTRFLFELIPKLMDLRLITSVSAIGVQEDFSLPVYTAEDLQNGIRRAQEEARSIKKILNVAEK